MQPLQDQIALVTGGSSGIGAGVALCLAQAGAKMVVNYSSSAEAAEDVVDQIKEKGGDAIALQTNVMLKGSAFVGFLTISENTSVERVTSSWDSGAAASSLSLLALNPLALNPLALLRPPQSIVRRTTTVFWQYIMKHL